MHYIPPVAIAVVPDTFVNTWMACFCWDGAGGGSLERMPLTGRHVAQFGRREKVGNTHTDQPTEPPREQPENAFFSHQISLLDSMLTKTFGPSTLIWRLSHSPSPGEHTSSQQITSTLHKCNFCPLFSLQFLRPHHICQV